MKTIWSILLGLLLLVTPAAMKAQDTYTNADGSIYTYSINADGSANIVACTPGTPFLTIPTNINGLTVTTIGDSAFENWYHLRTVTIPKGITSIGDEAFFACFDLASPTIPDSVTNIGTFAFDFCDSLTSITIPSGVTSIGEGAFLTPVLTNISVSDVNPAYSSLNGVLFNKAKDTLIQYPEALRNNAYTIPGTVTSIADIAFDGCTYLASVSIPGNVTNIGWAAFQECSSLTSITIPNAVTSIGDSAFNDCYSLNNVTICNSVTSIGNYAFEYCSSLTEINLGTNLTSIGASAFSSTAYYNVISGDPLHHVTIPDSVTSIGDSAFSNCGYLTNVTIGNGVTNIGDNAFDSCYSLNNVTIGSSVTTIGAEAFFNCGLSSITIPNNVTNIGYSAFNNCFNLTNAYFLGNAPSDDDLVFFNDPATVYYLAGTTGWGSTFGGVPAVLWNPQAVAISIIGIQSGNFGFTVTGVSGQTVIVEASTNLLNWQPVWTNTLSGASTNFSDSQWTNFPDRFYRAAFAHTVGGTLTGLPAGDTVTLQDNGADNLTLSANGPFTFPTALPDGHAYSITVRGIFFGGLTPTTCTLTNGSGTISGANVTNVLVQCSTFITGDPLPLTGNPDVDMLNAAVADGTAHGGVPGVMYTENGHFLVTANAAYSHSVLLRYPGWARLATIVAPGSCSSTTFPVGTHVIQFGTSFACQPDDLYGY